MAIQFPQDAAGNTPYTDPSTGYIYDWDGQKWNARVPVGSGSGIAGITIQDEGVSSNQDATTLNFVGAGVDVTGDGSQTKTITIPGGGGGGSVGTLQQVTDAGNTTDNTIVSTIDAGVNLDLNKGTGAVIQFKAGDDPDVQTQVGVGTSWVYQIYSKGPISTTNSDVFCIVGDNNSKGSFGDVIIGPNSADTNIHLGVDGSASFADDTCTINSAGGVTSRGFAVQQNDGTTTAQIFLDGKADFKNQLRVVPDDGDAVVHLLARGSNELDAKLFFLTKNAGGGTTGSLIYHDGEDTRLYFNGNTTAGTKHMALDTDGNFAIGGTLPSSPNIELNADGSAEFEGFVTSNSGLGSFRTPGNTIIGGSDTYGWSVSAAGNGFASAYVGYDGAAAFASSNVLINADGSTRFVREIAVDSYISQYRQTQDAAAGLLTLHSDFGDPGVKTAKAAFLADGSASFAGGIDSDGNGTWTGYVLTGDSTTGTYSVMDDSAIFTSYKAAGTADETTAFQIVRDGNLEYQVRADGEIQIGGTIPAAPNIALKADGSAAFVGGELLIDKSGNISKCWTISCLNNGTYNDQDTTLWNGYATDGTLTTAIRADGSAVYSGNVTVSSAGNPQAGAAAGSQVLQAGGFLCTHGTETAQLYRGYTQANATPTFEVLANGSASFAGSLTLGSPTQNGAGNGVYVGKDAEAGNITLYSEDNSSGGGRASSYLLGYSGGSSKTLKVDIAHDGSASFAGNIQAAGLTDGTTTKTLTEVLAGGAGGASALYYGSYDHNNDTVTGSGGFTATENGTGFLRVTFDSAFANADDYILLYSVPACPDHLINMKSNNLFQIQMKDGAGAARTYSVDFAILPTDSSAFSIVAQNHVQTNERNNQISQALTSLKTAAAASTNHDELKAAIASALANF